MILAIQLPNVSTASELDALKEAAAQGDVGTQLNIGVNYYYGYGVQKDATGHLSPLGAQGAVFPMACSQLISPILFSTIVLNKAK